MKSKGQIQIIVILLILIALGIFAYEGYQRWLAPKEIVSPEKYQECVNDNDCKEDETCENHICQRIVCGYCEYIENRQCKDYECCSDFNCDDNNPETLDKCIDPRTKNSRCEHEIVKKCDDGTIYDQCSINKPKYCDNGSLIDRCSVCGCPSGQQCQADESCMAVKAAVLVDNRLYELIKEDLDNYIELAEEKKGFEISLLSMTGMDDWSYTQVKDFIKDLKSNFPNLEGALLVGNIKFPSFYKPRGDNLQVRLFSQYYADLDGVFSRLQEPGTIDPLCPTNGPYCNVVAEATVPEHDFDYMGKGPNPDPELWIALLPVGFLTILKIPMKTMPINLDLFSKRQ